MNEKITKLSENDKERFSIILNENIKKEKEGKVIKSIDKKKEKKKKLQEIINLADEIEVEEVKVVSDTKKKEKLLSNDSQVIRISKNDLPAIDDLMALGFPYEEAAAAYIKCNRNKERAAEELLWE